MTSEEPEKYAFSIPEEVKLCQASGGTVLDPSHPFTLEKVEKEKLVQSAKGEGK